MTTLPANVNLSSLAREVAMDILELDDILRHHGLTHGQFQAICRNPDFARILTSMKAEWESALNTKERVKAKSSTLYEMALEIIARDVQDQEIPLNHRVAALQMVAKSGGIGNDELQGVVTGDRVSIVINLGADTLRFEHGGPSPETIDVTPGVTEEATT